MFEDSTFESTGRLHTRSRGWMIATFVLNASILLGLILIPLIYPSALPRMALISLMEAPATPVEEPKPVQRPANATVVQSQMRDGSVVAPTRIQRDPPQVSDGQEVLAPIDAAALADGGNGFGSADNPFGGHSARPDVRQAVKGLTKVSTGVMTGLLVFKVTPVYPQVAVAIRQSGTVVLQATISRSGSIENLRVVSGPALLQQAAVEAVKQWRYRPYLLNGEPVEVETTVNVDFTLN